MRLIAGLIVLTCAPAHRPSPTRKLDNRSTHHGYSNAYRRRPDRHPPSCRFWPAAPTSSASATVAVDKLVSGGVSTLTWTLTNTSTAGLIVTTIPRRRHLQRTGPRRAGLEHRGTRRRGGASTGVYGRCRSTSSATCRDSRGVCAARNADAQRDRQPGGVMVFSATFRMIPGCTVGSHSRGGHVPSWAGSAMKRGRWSRPSGPSRSMISARLTVIDKPTSEFDG